MKKNRIALIVTGGVLLIGAVGASPRYLEELRIGGGYGDPVDGGADFEKDGDLLANGDLTLGANEAQDHALSLTAGTSYDAFLNLYQADASNGGSLWFDGSLNTLYLGTRSASPTPTSAVSIAKGSADVGVAGNLTVTGGALTLSGSNPRVLGGNDGIELRRDGASGRGFAQDFGGSKFAQHFWGAGINLSAGTSDPSGESIDVPAGTLRTESDAYIRGGDIEAGVDSTTRGLVTLWDGAGAAAPGAIRLYSTNGSAWYLFVEDDGTVKIHASLPTANGDGSVVGGQF